MSDVSAPYTDSYIIQCDRNSSLEADTGNNENPAVFTNKQGTGLRLNAGDKVSVHSAFINEIGNTDGTIEFKGSSIKDTDGKEINYELEETEDTLSIPFPLDDLYSENTDFPWTSDGAIADLDTQWNYGQMSGQNKKQILQPYGFQRCDVANVKKSFVMKDNEMNIQIAYYKTCNGENYIHLPRRFDCMSGTTFATNGVHITARPSSRFPTTDDSLPWAYKGMQWSGCPVSQAFDTDELGFQDGGWNGQTTMDIRVQSQVKDDWTFQDKGRRWKCEGLTAGNDGGGVGISDRTLNVLGTTKRFRWKNDNSRYMLFKKERTFFTTAPQFQEFLDADQLGACLHPDNLEGSKTNDFLGYLPSGDASSGGHVAHAGAGDYDNPHYFNVRDPACTSNWVPYYEIKNIKVEEGFKSPEDVADEVSASLNKTGEPKEIYARTGKRQATIPADGVLGASHQLVGLKKDGEIFKSFYSTNHGHFNSGACVEYFIDSSAGALADMPEKTPGCARYMSAYHYIGVKRPELWIKGREFCEICLEVGAGAGATWGEVEEFSLHEDRAGLTFLTKDEPVCTNIPWENRHLLNKWIQAQGEYPELFNYGYSNIKELGSDYETDDNVSSEDFQMGNKETGETYARFIHFDLTKKNGDSWKDKGGKFKSGSRRLGSDNYDWQNNTDYDDVITGAETYTGYKTAGGVPPVSEPDKSTADLQGQLPYYDMSSAPLWFYYDQSRADFDGGGEDLACSDANLCYGCMKRYNPHKEGDGGLDFDYIAFSTEKIGGLPEFFFQPEGTPHGLLNATLDENNYIGVDRHFNAYGTKVIMPYSGYLNGTQPSTYVKGQDQADFYYVAQPGANKVPTGWDASPTDCKLEQTYQYALHTYIGSNGLSLNFDSEKLKRFNWQGLHTPEYIGNNFNAGSDATDPKIDDASNQVYKINKRLSGSNYCPEMQPYHTDITTTNKDATDTEISISATNWNLEQWSAIFDAHSGITFADFGGTDTNKKYWHKTLWGLLGFSYEQLNYKYETSGNEMNVKDRLSFNSRINPDNQGETPMIFTNAMVKASDVSLYRNNIYGAGMFSDQGLSYGSVWHGGMKTQGKIAPTEKDYLINNPAISVSSASVGIKADRQPTKMLRPYYLIKSNICGDMKYLGAGHSTEGGQMLPIIGVVNKENGFGDYYFQTDTKAIFTITQPTTLSEVKTSIHDPDMTSARVDKNSCVLYLVQKENTTNLNVVQTLLQEKEIKPEELEAPILTDAQYNEYFKSVILNPQQQAEEMEAFVFAHGGETPVPAGEVGQTLGGYVPPPRAVESLLGLRAGERPAPILNPSMPQHGTPERMEPRTTGKMTRKEAKGLKQFAGVRERAGVQLRRRFEGEQPDIMERARQWKETQAVQTAERHTPYGSEKSSEPSKPATQPSEPGAPGTPAQLPPQIRRQYYQDYGHHG